MLRPPSGAPAELVEIAAAKPDPATESGPDTPFKGSPNRSEVLLSHALSRRDRTSATALSSLLIDAEKNERDSAGSNRRASFVTASSYLEFHGK